MISDILKAYREQFTRLFPEEKAPVIECPRCGGFYFDPDQPGFEDCPSCGGHGGCVK